MNDLLDLVKFIFKRDACTLALPLARHVKSAWHAEGLIEAYPSARHVEGMIEA